MKSKRGRYKRRKRYLKGRRLQNYVRDKLLKTFPHLRKRDVSVALVGQQGPDIILSRTGKKLVGHNFEIKNQNRMSTVWKWYNQACKNTKLDAAVIMKSNTRAPLAVIDLDHFLDLIK